VPGNSSVFDTIFYETQLAKINCNPEFVTEIKEEIIEYNPDKNIIVRYIVIIERATNTLTDLKKIWANPEMADKKQEFYSDEKALFYLFQATKCILFLHQNNIYYGDMKGDNVLVFRNLMSKFGDLGISVKLPLDSTPETLIEIKGATQGYTSPAVSKAFEQGLPVSKRDLLENDRFALIKTF
jgi:serine/threonine protein kinase